MHHHTLPKHFREFVEDHHLINRGDSIIAAVSGGLDSMVMLNLLDGLSKALELKLAAAHFNHELREKESDDDESFVRAAARSYGIECYVERANTAAIAETKKQSVQEAARDLRYAFFNKLRSSTGFQKIATAHHADDNAETMVFNVFRGAGVNGLSGIPIHRKDIAVIRPMLFSTRDEIRSYASENGILHREDSSNKRIEYTRNYIRESLIPEIQRNINPNLVGTLRRTSEIFNQLSSYLDEECAKHLVDVLVNRTPRELVLDLARLHSKPVFLQEYLLHHLAREFAGLEADYTTVKALLNVSHAGTGTSCPIAKDIVAFRDRERLVLRQSPPAASFKYIIEPSRTYEYELFRFGSALVPEAIFNNDSSVEYVDADLIQEPLVLRSWNDGDSFVPLGMTEHQKVSDYFIDHKIPLFDKRSIPILLSNDAIVWICGQRLDDRFKVRPATRRILKLEFTPLHLTS